MRMTCWHVAGWLLGTVLLPVSGEAQEAAERAADRAPGAMTVVATGSGRVQSDGFSEREPLRLSMDFKDADLKDVLKVFSEQTGINVIASEDVGERTITLYLEDVTAMDALDQILQASKLIAERPAGSEIYIVKSLAEKPEILTITRIYPLKFARVSSSKLAKAVDAISSSSSTSSTDLSSSSSTTSDSTDSTSSDSGSTAAAGVGIDQVIEELLTEEGKVVVDERTSRLLVTDIPENFPRIEAAINALDVRTAQLLIEVEVLETTLSKVKDLGFEWGTGSEGDLFNFTADNLSRTSRFPLGWIGHGDAPSAPTRFGLSTLSFASFDGVLQALERDTDTKILARPKVLTLDNETAVIKLTSNQAVGFSSSTTPQSVTSSTPERVETGVSLTVTPQVNEGGYVTMVVEPSVTKVVTASVTPPSNQGTVVDPKTRSARAVVRIRNGNTLVMGGLIDHSDEDIERRVPILADVPFLGRAFRNTEINNSASELLVFVTPNILAEPPASQIAAVGPGPFALREQETGSSRQTLMEQTLKRLEKPAM